MIDYDLLAPEDYDDLPDDPEKQFLELERKARKRMYEVLDGSEDTFLHRDIRVQYMVAIDAAAKELGIPDVIYNTNGNDHSEDYDWFQQQVHATITRLRLRYARKNTAYTVRLANRSRGRIELEVTRLRDLVAEADFPPSKKEALNKRLDDLYAEIHQNRVSFARVMAILGVLGAAFGGTIGTLAAAPTAIVTITSLIGQDKEAEDEEAKRIGSSPKALPPPTASSKPQAVQGYDRPKPEAFNTDLDDEIPF